MRRNQLIRFLMPRDKILLPVWVVVSYGLLLPLYAQSLLNVPNAENGVGGMLSSSSSGGLVAQPLNTRVMSSSVFSDIPIRSSMVNLSMPIKNTSIGMSSQNLCYNQQGQKVCALSEGKDRRFTNVNFKLRF